MQAFYDALRQGTHPHAILLTSNDEAKAQEVVQSCAAILLCGAQAWAKKPCHACKGCAMFFSGNHPDFITLTLSDGKNTIGIEQVRALLQSLYTVAQFTNRVVFLKNAHLMTEQSQNALLKTLEEPPQNTLFLLTGNPEGLLVTIRSRVMRVKVQNQPPAQLDDAAKQSVEQMCAGQIHVQASYYAGYEKKRKQLEQLLELQAGCFLQSALYSPKQGAFVRCAEALLRAKQKLAQNANFNLVIDVLLLEIVRALQVSP